MTLDCKTRTYQNPCNGASVMLGSNVPVFLNHQKIQLGKRKGRCERTGAMAATGDPAGVWSFLLSSTTINVTKLQALCLCCNPWENLMSLLARMAGFIRITLRQTTVYENTGYNQWQRETYSRLLFILLIKKRTPRPNF